MLQLISVVLLVYLSLVTRMTIPTLPQRIPTHFNAAGAADGWGSPDIFWLLLGAQALCTVIFLGVPLLGQLFPGAIHFGRRRLGDFPPAQRPRIMALLTDMSAYMSIVMNVFFVLMLHEIIQAAREPIPHLHPLFPLGLILGGMVVITVYYFWRINAAAKVSDEARSSTQTCKWTCHASTAVACKRLPVPRSDVREGPVTNGHVAGVLANISTVRLRAQIPAARPT